MISGAQNYQLLAGANVSGNDVSGYTGSPSILPKNEWQVRPLDSLSEPEEKVHVWNMTVAEAVERGEQMSLLLTA